MSSVIYPFVQFELWIRQYVLSLSTVSCGCCSTFLSASRAVSGVLTHPIIPCTERVISFLLRMVALRERPLLLAGNV